MTSPSKMSNYPEGGAPEPLKACFIATGHSAPLLSSDGGKENKNAGPSRRRRFGRSCCSEGVLETGWRCVIGYTHRSCCAEHGLSPACTARCNFFEYTPELLQKMLVGADECKLDDLPDMQFCAAQGRDHSECCRHRGVTEVEAGDKCLVFCNQIPDRFTNIDYTYASCYGKFEQMKQCFYDNISFKAKSYFKGH